MRDRLPAYGMANRVKITQDDGTIVEGVLSYADGATQQGSAYNKANVLPDIVCKTLGLSTESEPRDMFDVLAHVGDLHVWKKTVVSEGDTAITYPVSTNRNAYQESSSIKAAGYVLGSIVNGYFQMGSGATTFPENVPLIKYGSSVSVSDEGNVSIQNETQLAITSDTSSVNMEGLKGKFFRYTQLPFSPTNFSTDEVYFIPSSATFTKERTGYWYVDKYQAVTGYAAVPAGTKIEYLGALGEKAIIEMGSYVGTGTYGLNNKNKIQFKKSPKLLIVQNIGNTPRVFITLYGGKTVSPTGSGTSSSGQLYITWSDTSVSWYAGTASTQLNDSGQTYNYLLVY